MSNNTEDYVILQALRVDALYNNAAIPVVVKLCGALGLLIAFWDERNTYALFLWFTVAIIITVMCCLIVLKYHSTQKRLEKYPFWLNMYFIGTLFSGIVCGTTAYVLPVENNIIELGIITMFMLVVISGSIGIYSVFKRIYYAFSLPIIVPLIIFLFAQDNEQLNQLGLITSIFTGFIFVIHCYAQKITNQLLIIKFDNKFLIDGYKIDQEKINILERLNRTRSKQLEKARMELNYLKINNETPIK